MQNFGGQAKSIMVFSEMTYNQEPGSCSRQPSPDNSTIIFPGDRVRDKEKIRIGKHLNKSFF